MSETIDIDQLFAKLTFVRDHSADRDYNDEYRRYRVILSVGKREGVEIGTVERDRHYSSTTYAGTRIRRDLGEPVGWSWNRHRLENEHIAQKGDWHERIRATQSNAPGLYKDTRREAARALLEAWQRAPELIARSLREQGL